MKKVLWLDMVPVLAGRYANIDTFKPYFELKTVWHMIGRKIWNMLGLKKRFWYGEWTKYLNNYDVVIIDDTFYDAELVKFIKDRNPLARIIMYYYNPVSSLSSYKNPDNVNRGIVELWSVDRIDCKNYDMNYNSLPFEQMIGMEKSCEIKWDIVFIGLDKGRADYINSLAKYFDKNNLKVFLFIYPSVSNVKHLLWVYYNKITGKTYRQYMDYQKVLEHTIASKAILEIVQDGQSCYTRRAMEALFLNKKLITNNKFIVNEPFYNSKNIFVLGLDNMENICDFINGENEKATQMLLDSYSYDQWIKNFDIDAIRIGAQNI